MSHALDAEAGIIWDGIVMGLLGASGATTGNPLPLRLWNSTVYLKDLDRTVRFQGYRTMLEPSLRPTLWNGSPNITLTYPPLYGVESFTAHPEIKSYTNSETSGKHEIYGKGAPPKTSHVGKSTKTHTSTDDNYSGVFAHRMRQSGW